MAATTYKNPTPTVDAVIRIEKDGVDHVVLIRRNNPPAGWALPGGFVDEGERMDLACAREALEETGLHVILEDLLYIYSDPRRDQRKHTVSAVFTARAIGEPVGQDDAAEAILVPITDLGPMADQGAGPGGAPIVFDHALILRDALRFFATGARPRPGDGPR
ncbi:MAG: NUDIX hydrolase [Deltaproteobacteria bacterium]|jgi:8-oxo-dGTP diphosphatase|nr:NUDIX hydrolase [Deltaproteobacteria bacterium]